MERSSIIPKQKVGDAFVPAVLGSSKGSEGNKKAKIKKSRPKRKTDPGKALMKKAALYESGKDWVTVIGIYKKVSKMGERSKYSKEATQKLDKLLAKKEVKEEYEDHQKKKQLEEDYAMAESFALAGRYDEVMKYCKQVMDASPGSNMAKKAKILSDWTKEMSRLQGQKEQK
jgi:hypothetical protein